MLTNDTDDYSQYDLVYDETIGHKLDSGLLFYEVIDKPIEVRPSCLLVALCAL